METASYTAAMAWRNPPLSAGLPRMVAKATPGVTIDNTGTIVGAPGSSTAIGQAGAGGAGLDLPSDSRLTNNGMITSGVGGDSFDEGGAGGSGDSTSSGAGGAGIDLLLGGVMANNGTILGGNGGAVSRQVPGIGGVGIQLEEFTAAWSADAVLTHSTDEEALLRRAVPDACVHRVPWHVPVPDSIAPFAARHGIAFIGNYAHAPNRDAAVWPVETVMPIVWATCPQSECRLVGADMPDSIRLLARPGVVAQGHVPDLADVLAGCG